MKIFNPILFDDEDVDITYFKYCKTRDMLNYMFWTILTLGMINVTVRECFMDEIRWDPKNSIKIILFLEFVLLSMLLTMPISFAILGIGHYFLSKKTQKNRMVELLRQR